MHVARDVGVVAADIVLLRSRQPEHRARPEVELAQVDVRRQAIRAQVAHVFELGDAGEGTACVRLEKAPLELARNARLVVTVEEHTVIGGLGSAVTDALVECMDGHVPRIRRIGIPDVFTKDYGGQEWLMETFGIRAPQIADCVRKAIAS